MNKRQINRVAFDAIHRHLMRRYHYARGGEKQRRLKILQAWMVEQLRAGK